MLVALPLRMLRSPAPELRSLGVNTLLNDRLQAIRLAASMAMGIAGSLEEAKAKRVVPFIGFVSKAADAQTLECIEPARARVTRSVRAGLPHRARRRPIDRRRRAPGI